MEDVNILSWNINGIRSYPGKLTELFSSLQADIICIQETKITREALSEDIAFLDGYSSYFSCSRKRSGYSGVATYCSEKLTPTRAEEGLTGLHAVEGRVGCYGDIAANFTTEQLRNLDAEGRAIITQHTLKDSAGVEYSIAVINVYCPRADPDKEDRVLYKLEFYALLELRVVGLLEAGIHVVVLGDINTTHQLVDSCDPGIHTEFLNRPSRLWLDNFLVDIGSVHNDKLGDNEDVTKLKLVDTFRYFHPGDEKVYTCWNTERNARELNYGTRLDYIMVDAHLLRGVITDSIVRADVMGSDHCPVQITCSCEVVACDKPPKACTRFYPEFSGKQQTLARFLVKREHQKPLDTSNTSNKKKKQMNLNSYFGNNQVKKTVNSVEKVCTPEISKPNVVAVGSNNAWSFMMKGPKPAPICPGHKETSVLKTVTKKGANLGRKFYACSRGVGEVNDPQSRCDFFLWANDHKP